MKHTARSTALIACLPILLLAACGRTEPVADMPSQEELAAAAGYSRRHLERLFRDAVGKSPADFYRGLRLDLGRNLLSTTEMTLLEVSLACGFATVSHFSKSFRARYGVAPTRLVQGLDRKRTDSGRPVRRATA